MLEEAIQEIENECEKVKQSKVSRRRKVAMKLALSATDDKKRERTLL
jgi:hypothetical protein